MKKYKLMLMLLILFPLAAFSEDKARLLWVLTAKQAIIVHDKNDYQLILKGIYPKVLYFADRPRRFAGNMDAQQFLNNWPADGFKKSEPNSAFVHAGMTSQLPTEQEAFAFELLTPRKISKDNWQFTLKILKGDTIKVGQFKDASLFIDSSSLNSSISHAQW